MNMESVKKRFSEILNRFKKHKTPPAEPIDDATRSYMPVHNAPLTGDETILFDGSKQLASAKGRQKNRLVRDDDPSEPIFLRRRRRDIFPLSVAVTTVKVAVVAIILLAAAGLGAVFGLATAYLDTAPELDLAAIENQDLTSYLYDSDGKEIAIYTGLENRDWAGIDEIPLLLQRAVISVEDARFYNHNGVDFKRTVGSFISNLSSDSVQGGSTITQQLIKNQLLSSERSYKRKIQEAYLAMELEKKYSKDQILEAYLNTIPLGGIVYGVKAAAKEYFGKELSELTLREMACIAGITRYPYKYSPYRCYYGSDDPAETAKRIDDLDFRIDTVLVEMYEQGYISREELDAAEADGLTVVHYATPTAVYDMPHFVEYAVYDITNHLIDKRGLEDTTANRQAIENELRTQGYKIYLTVDVDVQNTVQDTLASYAGYPKMADSKYNTEAYTDSAGNVIAQPQSASVVIDQHTGYIKALVGARTEPAALKTFNRAYQSKIPVGSSIKPIAVYGPAFDGGMGLASIIENIPVPIDGWTSEKGYPLTSSGTFGPTPLRTAIVKSLNICAARTLMDHVGLSKAAEYLENLGVDPTHIEKTGYGLALGGSSITPLELAEAYACIANGGEYKTAVSFTKIVAHDGAIVLSADDVQETRQVFKKSTAYMLVSALTEAATSGTGKRAKIEGITTAGKTGTNEDNKGMFFAGFTGYYTSTVWVGHDLYVELEKDKSAATVTAPLWNEYMTKLHAGKSDRAILAGSEADYSVEKVTVCAVSGMLPSAFCKDTVTDYMAKSDVPVTHCTWHVSATTCSVTGMIAGEYCPSAATNKDGAAIVLPQDSPYRKLTAKQLAAFFPNLKEGETCTLHTKEWTEDQAALAAAKNAANELMADVKAKLDAFESDISGDDAKNVRELLSALEAAVKDKAATSTAVNKAASNLREVADRVFKGMKPAPTATPKKTAKPTATPGKTPKPSATIDPNDPDDPGKG